MTISLLLILCLLLTRRLDATRQCPAEEGGGICPSGNTCCPRSRGVGVNGTELPSSLCLTGSQRDFDAGLRGACCASMDDTNTGCSVGYQCNRHPVDGSEVCELQFAKPGTHPPRYLPRYQLCDPGSFDVKAIQEIYGFTLPVGTESEASSPVLAYYSSHGDIQATESTEDEWQSRIQSVFIMVHGSMRNADDYMCAAITSLVAPDFDLTNTLLIAPFFAAPQDRPVVLSNSGRDVLIWDETFPYSHSWRYGASALNRQDISSYSAIDALVDYLYDSPAFSSFERLIVAGHSAGGQFTHRWALLSNARVWRADSLGGQKRLRSHQKGSSSRQVAVRVVAANPRSYCYLDARRMLRKLDGSNGGELQFREPTSAERSACPHYNHWEWGLEDGGVLVSSYKDEAIQLAGGIDAMVQRYATQRSVVYLTGRWDNETLHDGCISIDFEGTNRHERAFRFFEALKQKIPSTIHRMDTVDSFHDHFLMFQSPEGRRALFGDWDGVGGDGASGFYIA